MVTLITILVYVFAAALLAAGVYFQVRREELGSDPVLIWGCYVFGGGLILANLLIPLLSH